MKRIELLAHQMEFCADMSSPYIAMCAGFGSGKTRAFAIKHILLASRNVGYIGAALTPTAAMARDLVQPTLEELLELAGIDFKYRASPLPEYVLYFPNGKSKLLVRSFENWRRLRGLDLAWFGVDEADTVNADVADAAWKTMISRVRVGPVRQCFATSTPEGFRWMWRTFERDARNPDGSPRTDRRLVRGRTYDNPFLPASYIESLEQNYPPALIKAYLEGQFVNLTSGQVYNAFDRKLNHCPSQLRLNDRLHIGVDFNVGATSAIVHIVIGLDDGRWVGYRPQTNREALSTKWEQAHAVAEFQGMTDTPALIAAIKQRFGTYLTGRQIVCYPDAAGNHTDATNASESSLSLLRQAGLMVDGPSANPLIKDRVTAMNAMFLNGQGIRRYYVNSQACPLYVEALEQQAYDPKTGKPDKQNGHDNRGIDAAGYFISYRYEARERKMHSVSLSLVHGRR